jgi:hypothetical protein
MYPRKPEAGCNKALLSYSLKRASCKPKHVAAIFFLIFYVIKLS